MIFDFRGAFGDLAAYQVVLKVAFLQNERVLLSSALRGQLYEAIEHRLVMELSALAPEHQESRFAALDTDLLRNWVEACAEPLLAAHNLALREIQLRPLWMVPPSSTQIPDSPDQALRLSHQWVEASIGPIKLKDQFTLVADVVARVLCNPIVMERAPLMFKELPAMSNFEPKPGRKRRKLLNCPHCSEIFVNPDDFKKHLATHGAVVSFAPEPLKPVWMPRPSNQHPLDDLTRDLWGALGNLAPHIGLEDWTSSAGSRATALLAGLQCSPFAKWLHGAHVPYFGNDQKACVDACWITDSRFEPVR